MRGHPRAFQMALELVRHPPPKDGVQPGPIRVRLPLRVGQETVTRVFDGHRTVHPLRDGVRERGQVRRATSGLGLAALQNQSVDHTGHLAPRHRRVHDQQGHAPLAGVRGGLGVLLVPGGLRRAHQNGHGSGSPGQLHRERGVVHAHRQEDVPLLSAGRAGVVQGDPA